MSHVEVEIPYGKGNVWELSGQLKSIGDLCYGTCSKGIIRSSITARHAMRPFVKLL